MSRKQVYNVPRRRRREGKTNYLKRYNLLKSEKPRLVARIKSKTIIAQLIEYKTDGDVVLASTNSLELKKHGWVSKRNIPTAYLTGLLLGKKAIKKGIKDAVLDIGLHRPKTGGKIFAVLKERSVTHPIKKKQMNKIRAA